MEDLRQPRLARLGRHEQARVLLVEVRLLIERVVELLRRSLERLGLFSELVDQVAREADDPGRRWCRWSAVLAMSAIEASGVDEQDLCQLRERRNALVPDQDDVEDHRPVGDRGEVRECQRAPERRGRLIDDAEERQEEDPAVLRAGVVDRHGVHRHVGREEHNPEIQDRPHVLVEQVQQVPRDEAVDADDGNEAKPRRPREALEPWIDEGVVKEGAGGDEHEAEQAQPRDDLRVELDQPQPLESVRLGVIDLEIE